MEEKLSLRSDGLRLSAVLHVPGARKAGQRLPAFIVLHGFVGSKDESHAEIQARMLEEMGYVALRFDFRGCGESEGERAQVRCFDQVADAKNAMTVLAEREEVDPSRIGEVLINLIHNGLKYTPSGGRVSVCAAVNLVEPVPRVLLAVQVTRVNDGILHFGWSSTASRR